MNQLNLEVEQRFSDWQRRLATKGRTISASVADKQGELHSVVYKGPLAFAAYLRGQLGLTTDDSIDAPVLPSPIDASDYRDPPFKLERTLSNSWDGLIRRRESSRPVFWTLAHIRWLEEGQLGDQIEGTFLLGGGRDSTDDQRTRNLLRRVGGLPHVRGKVSVLSDSPISRAWWRGSVASEIADAAEDELTLSAADVHQVLHSHNDAWARLVGDSVHRITVMNQPRARAALIKLYEGATREGEPVRPQEIQLAARILSRHSVALAFEHVDWNELTDIAKEALERARAELALEAQGKAQASNKKSRTDGTQSTPSQPSDLDKPKSRWASLLPFSRG